MTILTLTLMLSMAALFLVALWFFSQKIKNDLSAQIEESKKADQSTLLLQQQLDALRNQVQNSLESNTSSFANQLQALSTQMTNVLSNQGSLMEKTHKGVGERLDNAARVVGELQSRLGKMEEANLKIYDVGKDIASLQEILRAPKLRGNLGEHFLGDLLRQVLPADHFEMQYSFKNGEKVDAVVKLTNNFVAIDSKFPLENFKKYIETTVETEKKMHRKVFLNDVKKHIDAIAQKYIKPDENTFDFALMYIPAENVYYEMIIKEEAFDADFSVTAHAMAKRVIPVSPNNFYVYLNTILLGLKGMRIESSAKEILSSLSRLQGDLRRFNEDFSKIGTHLSNARSAYEAADKRLGKFDEKLESLTLMETQAPLRQISGGSL